MSRSVLKYRFLTDTEIGGMIEDGAAILGIPQKHGCFELGTDVEYSEMRVLE